MAHNKLLPLPDGYPAQKSCMNLELTLELSLLYRDSDEKEDLREFLSIEKIASLEDLIHQWGTLKTHAKKRRNKFPWKRFKRLLPVTEIIAKLCDRGISDEQTSFVLTEAKTASTSKRPAKWNKVLSDAIAAAKAHIGEVPVRNPESAEAELGSEVVLRQRDESRKVDSGRETMHNSSAQIVSLVEGVDGSRQATEIFHNSTSVEIDSPDRNRSQVLMVVHSQLLPGGSNVTSGSSDDGGGGVGGNRGDGDTSGATGPDTHRRTSSVSVTVRLNVDVQVRNEEVHGHGGTETTWL